MRSTARAPTVACQVCREDVAVAETVGLRACGHRFCASCLSTFLTLRIRDGDVVLSCFYHDDTTANACGVRIEVDDVQAFVTLETFAAFQRFVLIQSTAQARQCPFCDQVQVTSATVNAPACVCEACGRSFCFTHGNAHAESESCAQYEKRQSHDEKRSGRMVLKISRPCPECARPIEKNGGCSHMTCRVCKTQFCWQCGMRWGFDYTTHYKLFHLDCCTGIAEAKVPFIDSTSPCVRRLVQVLYCLMTLMIAWPLTLVLCWAWIPYTLWAEQRAVLKRARVLARCIAIASTIAIIFVFALLVLITVEVSDWFIDQTSRGLAKLRQLVCDECCRRRNSNSKAMDPRDFVVLQDRTETV